MISSRACKCFTMPWDLRVPSDSLFSTPDALTLQQPGVYAVECAIRTGMLKHYREHIKWRADTSEALYQSQDGEIKMSLLVLTTYHSTALNLQFFLIYYLCTYMFLILQ